MIPKTSIPLYDEQDSVNAQKAIQENREKNIAQIQVTEIETEGPLPSPYILRGYDEISPGAAKIIIDEGLKLYPKKPSIRMDTHDDNLSMQRFLIKYGFEYCGTIYLENKETRRAYEKIL